MNIPYFLLQGKWQGFGGGPANNTPALIGIGVAVGIVIIIVVISRITSAGRANDNVKTYRPAMFRKQGRKLGLPDNHIKNLETMVKRYNITYPYNLYKNTPLLDQTLGRAMKELEESSMSDEAKALQKQSLFRIKQIIELKSQKKNSLSSSKQLKVNQPLVLAPTFGGRYKSRVVSVLPEALSVEAPMRPDGKLVISKRGQVMTVYFWKESGSAYTFSTKVSGFKPLGSVQTMMLQHVNRIEQSQQRRYRRKEVDKPAYYFRVNVIESGRGRKKKKEAVLDSQVRNLGTLLEISAGGCSIKTTTPLQKGDLIKVQFEPVRKHQIAAFGKVRQISRRKPVGYIMHVMFTKVSRQHLNDINEYVYELVDA